MRFRIVQRADGSTQRMVGCIPADSADAPKLESGGAYAGWVAHIVFDEAIYRGRVLADDDKYVRLDIDGHTVFSQAHNVKLQLPNGDEPPADEEIGAHWLVTIREPYGWIFHGGVNDWYEDGSLLIYFHESVICHIDDPFLQLHKPYSETERDHDEGYHSIAATKLPKCAQCENQAEWHRDVIDPETYRCSDCVAAEVEANQAFEEGVGPSAPVAPGTRCADCTRELWCTFGNKLAPGTPLCAGCAAWRLEDADEDQR